MAGRDPHGRHEAADFANPGVDSVARAAGGWDAAPGAPIGRIKPAGSPIGGRVMDQATGEPDLAGWSLFSHQPATAPPQRTGGGNHHPSATIGNPRKARGRRGRDSRVSERPQRAPLISDWLQELAVSEEQRGAIRASTTCDAATQTTLASQRDAAIQADLAGQDWLSLVHDFGRLRRERLRLQQGLERLRQERDQWKALARDLYTSLPLARPPSLPLARSPSPPPARSPLPPLARPPSPPPQPPPEPAQEGEADCSDDDWTTSPEPSHEGETDHDNHDVDDVDDYDDYDDHDNHDVDDVDDVDDYDDYPNSDEGSVCSY